MPDGAHPLWLALGVPAHVLDRSTWRCHAFGSASSAVPPIAAPEPGGRHRARR